MKSALSAVTFNPVWSEMRKLKAPKRQWCWEHWDLITACVCGPGYHGTFTCCWPSYTISLQRVLTLYRHTGYHIQCAYMEIETNGKIIYCFWNNRFSLWVKFLIKQREWNTGTCYYSLLSVLTQHLLISDLPTVLFDMEPGLWFDEKQDPILFPRVPYFSPNPVSVLLISAGNPDSPAGQ